jgi:FAD dependent oxidoreductase
MLLKGRDYCTRIWRTSDLASLPLSLYNPINAVRSIHATSQHQIPQASASIMSLPVATPSKSYWQIPPSRLASYRSPFPERSDVVILGSGLTGVSVARALSEQDNSLGIVLLDARKLCSGATGRNGGHCKPCISPCMILTGDSFLFDVV